MTIAVDPHRQRKFNALRAVLSIMKNNGNQSQKQVSHNDVFDFLFSHNPLITEVEEYMQQTDKTHKKIAENREKMIAKLGEEQ